MKICAKRRYGDLLGAIALVIIPLAVVPQFLDYAQGTKSILLVSLAIWAGWRFISDPNPVQLPAKEVGIAITLVSVFYLITMIGAPNFEGGLYIAFSHLCALFAAWHCRRSMSDIQLITWLAIGGTVVAACGLVQVAFDIRWLVPVSDPGQFPAVTFGNRGLASLFVALGVLPTVRLRELKPSRQVYYVSALCIQLAFITVCATRSVWLGLAVSASVYLIFCRGKRFNAVGWVKILLGIFVIGTIGFFVIPESSRQTLTTLWLHRFDPQNWINNPRWIIFGATWNWFFAQGIVDQIFGHGLGSFTYYGPEIFSSLRLGNRVFIHAHSDPLQLLIEGGIAGVVSVMLAIFLCFRYRRRSGQDSLLFSCILLVMLFASFLFYPMQLSYFVFIAGILTIPREFSAQRLSLPVRLATKGVVFALCAIASVFASHMILTEWQMHEYSQMDMHVATISDFELVPLTFPHGFPTPLIYQRKVSL